MEIRRTSWSRMRTARCTKRSKATRAIRSTRFAARTAVTEKTAPAPDRTIGTVIFKGKSGEEYRFNAWPLTAKFKAVGGVYIVTKRSFEDRTFTTKASHQPLVIGHTADLAD